MAGIVFFGTLSRESVVEFYVERVGADRWLDQPDCTILRYDTQLLGFCDRDRVETDGTITFVFESAAVDDAYDHLSDVAHNEPVENERYRIYQFFTDDPEGRTVEFQTFLHETPRV